MQSQDVGAQKKGVLGLCTAPNFPAKQLANVSKSRIMSKTAANLLRNPRPKEQGRGIAGDLSATRHVISRME